MKPNQGNIFYNIEISNLSSSGYNLFIDDGQNSLNNALINVTYDADAEESIGTNSSISRYWYLSASSNVEGTNITLYNQTSGEVLYSALSENFETQTLTAYTNVGGTVTNETYNISATKGSYISQSQIFNLTNNTEISFTLSANPVEETTAPSTSSSSTSYPSESDISEGYSKSLGKNWKIKFTVNNESHQINVDKILENSVTLTISSDPVTFNISVGETKKLDLDSDEVYDISILLKNIIGTSLFPKAEIFIKSINEKIEKNVVSEEPAKNVEETSSVVEESEGLFLWAYRFGKNNWYYLVGVIILVGVVISLILIGVKRKGRRKHK